MNLKTMPMEQRMLLVWGGFMGLVLAVLALAVIAQGISGLISPSEVTARSVAHKSEPFVPFPNAAEVRLVYGKDGLAIDKTGKASNGAIRPIRLNDAQAAIARSSFTWNSPPTGYDACCVPRHAFTFHDAKGAFLGSLTFCLECTCTFTQGVTAPAGMDWIEWDEPKLVGLIRSLGVEAKTY
jgi:hypothetical protein